MVAWQVTYSGSILSSHILDVLCLSLPQQMRARNVWCVSFVSTESQATQMIVGPLKKTDSLSACAIKNQLLFELFLT